MCESWPFKTHGISLPLWHWLEQSRQINQENAGISPRTSPQSRRKCDVGFHQSGGAGESGGLKDSDESRAIITVFLLSSSWKINLIIPWCKWYQSAWRRMSNTSRCGLSDKYEDLKRVQFMDELSSIWTLPSVSAVPVFDLPLSILGFFYTLSNFFTFFHYPYSFLLA